MSVRKRLPSYPIHNLCTDRSCHDSELIDRGDECSTSPSRTTINTQFHPCVANLPGYSERLASEKKTTHLVHSDLLELTMVRKSWCESTGRCTGCEFGRGVGNAIHFAHQQQLHFRSLPDNTVVYSNLLINIPQCGIRENTHTLPTKATNTAQAGKEHAHNTHLITPCGSLNKHTS